MDFLSDSSTYQLRVAVCGGAMRHGHFRWRSMLRWDTLRDFVCAVRPPACGFSISSHRFPCGHAADGTLPANQHLVQDASSPTSSLKPSTSKKWLLHRIACGWHVMMKYHG